MASDQETQTEGSPETATSAPACPVCASNASDTLYSVTDGRLETTDQRFQVRACGGCDSWYLEPFPTGAQIASYYPDEYHEVNQRILGRRLQARGTLRRQALRTHMGYPMDATSALPDFLWRWLSLPSYLGLRYHRHHTRVIPHVGLGRLLDVGCGCGEYLFEMRGLGWQVQGTDFSANAVRAARELTGAPIHHGDLLSAKYPTDAFDAITMWHVLEHLPEPRTVLREAHRLVAGTGTLAVGVPDASGLPARWFGEEWLHLDPPRHLISYTKRSLARLLEEEGWRVLRIIQDRAA